VGTSRPRALASGGFGAPRGFVVVVVGAGTVVDVVGGAAGAVVVVAGAALVGDADEVVYVVDVVDAGLAAAAGVAPAVSRTTATSAGR
jgi:hypothetical protein